MSYSLPQLLKALIDQKGSDLHISPDSPPRLRIDGSLLPLDVPPLTPQDCQQLCYSVLNEQQRKEFEEVRELDLAFSVKNLARFRANIYTQKGHVSGAFRVIPFKVYGLKELGLPPILEKLCSLPRGLVLVTGPTGSGKSTTLAAMVNHINETRSDHIVTIEDPVEFVHSHKHCLVNQREVGHDTKSFARALKSALRQDPDVVLVGELRDLETVSLAVTTAETGHLVFATLHTNSCVSTLNRIIDVFPPTQQLQIRSQLSSNLQATISQILLPANGGGRVLAMEVMIPNSAVRNLIREDKFHQIYSSMQTGQDQSGMQTLNQALLQLIERKQIGVPAAMEVSAEPQELEMLLQSKLGIKVPSAHKKINGADMAQFRYKVRDTAGKIQTGTMAGGSKDIVKSQFTRRRMRVISLQEVKLDVDGKEIGGFSALGGFVRMDSKGNLFIGNPNSVKFSDKDLIVFVKQLATMLASGVPLNQSLDILSNQQASPSFGNVLGGVRRSIEEGNGFSASLNNYPKVFDDLFRAMVKAGEESGKLAEILLKLVSYIEKSAKIKTQVKSALVYPAIIVCVSTGVVAGLLLFVVPTFASIFKESGKPLPGLTQMVIDASDLLKEYWYIIFGGGIGGGFGFSKWAKTPQGRPVVDLWVLKAPVIGDVMKKIAVGRFCSTMSSMLSAGVNLLQALVICASSAGNVVIERFIRDAKGRIEQGQQLSQPLSENPIFPKMVVSMIQIGEKSGKVDDMLEKVSVFYEEEVDAAIKTMLGMIEPILIVFIGGLVGTVVIAMYLPIFEMANVAGG